MLSVENLHVSYGGIKALSGVSLEVARGGIVTLIGANGAGKSTTVRAISGQVKPTSGRILFEGRDIAGQPPHLTARLGVAQIPEGRRIFANLTVMENLFMGGYCRDRDATFMADLDRVFGVFPRLAERRAQRGGTLSGGERQMLAIGRALMAQPKLIMMDEPSLGLAPKLVDEVFEIIARINAGGVTILLIEQNAMAALSVAHHGYVMETGRMTMSGPGRELLVDERVRRAYLGEDAEG